MSTVREYKSTDPGAPPHPSATRGSQAALLRACLVTGYGSGENFKAPAGWEEPFAESGNLAVFRALAGARQFFQIDDTQSSANVTRIRAFEAMSSIDTGTGEWTTAVKYFGKQWITPIGTEWFVFADERTVYVVLTSRYGFEVQGFGEMQSLTDDDPYGSFVAGHEGSSAMGAMVCDMSETSNILNHTNTVRMMYQHRSPDGVKLGVRGKLMGIQGSAYLPGCVGGAANQGVIPAGLPMSHLWLPVHFVPRSDDWGNLGTRYLPSALMRGLYQPLVGKPLSNKQTFTVGDKTFLALDLTSSGVWTGWGQIAFDITGSW